MWATLFFMLWQLWPFPGPGRAPSGTVVVSLASICSAGTGGTDTTCLQTAFNTTASAGEVLEIPAAASGQYNTAQLTAPSNLQVWFDSGVNIEVVSGTADNTFIINGDNNSNIILKGLGAAPSDVVIFGRKNSYASGEGRHCMSFAGSTNILVQNFSCNLSGGDGIYIGEGTQTYAKNIEVSHMIFDQNARNGITIISCDTCNIHDSSGTNTSEGTSGAASDGPWAGIDIEPNVAADRLVNITLTNDTFTGNGVTGNHASSNGNGLNCHFDLLVSGTTPANVSISASGITSSNNINDGFHVTNEHDTAGQLAPGGSFAITSSVANGNGRYGAIAYFYDSGGPVLSITGSTFNNNNSSMITDGNVDFAIERGGGATNNMGGVHYTGNSITSTNGNLQWYFEVEDYSSVGYANITVGSFGGTSGCSSCSTLGLFGGVGVNSVSQP